MYRKSPSKFNALIKLIDQAVLPAVVLVASKILGLILVNKKFDLDWQVSSSGIVYASKSDFVVANSYSSLFMHISITIGLALLVVRAVKWHSTHISPSLAARLYERRMGFLITDSLNLYSGAVVWLSYSWLATALMLIQSYYNLMVPWVAYSALFVSVISTMFLIFDVEKEFNAEGGGNVFRKRPVSIFDIAGIIKDND